MEKQGVTIDELIDSLNACVHDEQCEKCIECGKHSGHLCWEDLMRISADALEQLKQREKFHEFLWNTINPNQMEVYMSMYNAGMKGEKSDGNRQK